MPFKLANSQEITKKYKTKNKRGKMKINWFPGHMSKALNEMKKMLKIIDVVIYVLDSRAPISSVNPSLNKISENKPVLYVFNKTDLADEAKIASISKSFKGEGFDYVCLNSTMSGAGKIIKQKLKTLANAKIQKYLAKGVKTTIRALVVGVPNSGKSTLINNLCGKAKAITGDRPGVTKQNLWLPLGDNIEICDTPGTLYPNLVDQEIALNLAFIGSIKDIIVDQVELAEALLGRLNALYPQLITNRYCQNATLEDVAKKRGYLTHGSLPDYERTAQAIIDDFRKGRIGKITLD